MKKYFYARILLTILLTVSLCAAFTGCGKAGAQSQSAAPRTVSEEDFDLQSDEADAAEAETARIIPDADDTGPETKQDADDPADGAETEKETESDEEQLPDEDGVYTSKDDVALYIHVYGRLPSNFMTKKQAKKLGWSGGSLEDYAPGMCIGGDYFGNYEGLLPEGKEYHECDIDTLGRQKRGGKRIIYSDDGYIYYTEDHYESFELLYSP